MMAWATRALADRRAPWLAAVLAMALTAPSLTTGLVVDDWVHRVYFLRQPGVISGAANMFAFVPEMMSNAGIAFPWWATPDLKLSLFRPLSGLTHFLDYALWPDSPWMMHLHSVLWYGAAVLSAGVLFRRVMGAGWMAGLAALIYGISHTHSVPVFFIANRNALVGVAFSALALTLHHEWRANRAGRAGIAAPAALLLGLLGNEGAVATLGYLLGYAWVIDRAPWRSRAFSLLPAIAVVASWRILYQTLGYGAWGSEAYIDPIASPIRFIEAVVVRAPILLNAQWLFPPADLFVVAPASIVMQWAVIALALIIALALVLLPLLRRVPSSRFWALGMILAVIPACATFPMDRLLMHADLGFAALLAQFIGFATSAARHKTQDAGPPLRRLVTRITLDVLVALHVMVTLIWLPGRIVLMAGGFQGSTLGIEQLARRADLSDKLVVFVDDVMGSAMYFPAIRELAGLPQPAHVLVLSPAIDRTATLLVRRESPETLVVEHVNDYPWFLERDRLHPFHAGDRVRRGPIEIEVRTVRDGKPLEVAFHFDRPLDDPSIVWLGRFEPPYAVFPTSGGRYPEWTPPPIGRTVSAR